MRNSFFTASSIPGCLARVRGTAGIGAWHGPEVLVTLAPWLSYTAAKLFYTAAPRQRAEGVAGEGGV